MNPPNLDWRDGDVPVAVAFGDPYFSLDGGLDEARHVFLRGNNLPARFCDGFHIGETGFGTGLNLLATLHAWRQAGIVGKLRFTSFEAFPLPVDAAARALAAFPEVASLAQEVLAQWGRDLIALPEAEVRVIVGDVRATLPQWRGDADAWFLDGFAPARNPEMWDPAVLRAVAGHTRPGGTFATYTAATAVRASLAEAGFSVDRRPGFGRKKHMTAGRL
jgi:tRNA U34 5-methylaminomethyl-2-thiouridine-forming methyltransferase MnmC